MPANTRNELLLVQEPEMARTRGCPQGAENLNRRTIAFEASTNRVPSQFERVEMETAGINEIVDPEVERVIQRADPAPGKRGRPRGRPRDVGKGAEQGGRKKQPKSAGMGGQSELAGTGGQSELAGTGG